MSNSDSIQFGRCSALVLALSDRQRKDFGFWMQGPWVPHRRKFSQFWEQYQRALLAREEVSKRALAQELFPSSANPLSLFEKKRSELLVELYKFLAWEEMQSSSAWEGFFQLKALEKLGEQENYKALLRKLEKLQEPETQSELKLQCEFQSHRHHTQLAKSSRPKVPSTLQAHKAIDTEFATQKLRWACLARNQDLVLGTESHQEIHFLSEVINWARGHLSQLPLVAVLYLKFWEVLSEEEDMDRFHDFRKTLLQGQSRIEEQEARKLTQLYINHLVRLINRGGKVWQRELAEFYKSGLKERLFHDSSGEVGLNPQHFKNIVFFMAKAGELEWLENEASQCLSELPKPHQERAGLFFRGAFFFFSQDYSASIKALHELVNSPDDIFYLLDGRLLLIKGLYELGKREDDLPGELESFRKYLSRNEQKIPAARISKYEAFHLHVKRLARLDGDLPAQARLKASKMREELSEQQGAHLDWVREKLEDWWMQNKG